MSCYTKEQLENMLENVINELDLSEDIINKHGEMGTAPAELVRFVLKEKDKKIAMLKNGFIDLQEKIPADKDKPWFCPNCCEWISSYNVTFNETHDERNGGCGYKCF